jgi:hypothetical protein
MVRVITADDGFSGTRAHWLDHALSRILRNLLVDIAGNAEPDGPAR